MFLFNKLKGQDYLTAVHVKNPPEVVCLKSHVPASLDLEALPIAHCALMPYHGQNWVPGYKVRPA